jgi:hypothetical protein
MNDSTDRRSPNYLALLLRMLEREPLKSGVTHVTVYHDTWCALLKGTGACNCEPVIGHGAPPNRAARRAARRGR